MHYFKSLILGLALVSAMFTTSTTVMAQTIGVVDADKVLTNYSKAQDVEADLKVKEAEIQKFIADAQKQIKDAATPVEKNNLEKKLSEEFKAKQTEYRKMQITESEKINNDIITAIKTIAKDKSIDMVLAKGAVFSGGTDLTEEVLGKLNVTK